MMAPRFFADEQTGFRALEGTRRYIWGGCYAVVKFVLPDAGRGYGGSEKMV